MSNHDYMAKLYFDDVRKYANMNNVPLDNFDFYTDYTDGEFLKTSGAFN